MKYNTPRPEGDWRKKFGVFELAGSHFVVPAIDGFVRETYDFEDRTAEVKPLVIREDYKIVDRNALRVDATWKSHNWKLSYIPRDLAAQISEKFEATMPIACSIIMVRFLAERVYVQI